MVDIDIVVSKSSDGFPILTNEEIAAAQKRQEIRNSINQIEN